MRYLLLLAIPLIFLGVGCASSETDLLSSTSDIAAPVVAPERTMAPSAEGNLAGLVSYRTAGKREIVFSVPRGWFVRQADAGNASVVTIRDAIISETFLAITLDTSGGVSISSTLPASSSQVILDSIILSPTQDELDGVDPAPEWTLEDTKH